jgi:hypothetical protein
MTDLTSKIGMTSLESQDQRVETEILEVSASSQSQCKFLLPQKGLLESDVFFTFKATVPNTHQDAPLMCGGLSFLRRISMYYGNVLLADCDQLAHLLQLKNTFVDQDIRDQVYQTEILHFSGLKVDENAVGKKGMYSLDAEDDGSGIVGLEALSGTVYNKKAEFRLQTTAAATPEISVPLRAVFPFLSQTQLPLGLLNERITVVIDFNDDLLGVRTVVNQTVGAGEVWAAGSNVVLDSCKLLLDLVYYDEKPNRPSPMARIASEIATKGIELVYTDYIHVENYLPALAAPPATPQDQTKVIRLGLDSQIVRNILIATPKQANYGDSTGAISSMSHPILGDYNSRASQGRTTLQCKINNRNLFVNALDMDCKLWNELSQVYGTPAKSNCGLTSFVGQIENANYALSNEQCAFPTDKYMYGHAESSLCGSLGYLGINLSRTYDNVAFAGMSVGKSPLTIDLTYQRTQENYEQNRVLIWCENERVMLIKNGTIFVSGS